MFGFAFKALVAALSAAAFLTLTTAQAVANHVECGDLITQGAAFGGTRQPTEGGHPQDRAAQDQEEQVGEETRGHGR